MFKRIPRVFLVYCSSVLLMNLLFVVKFSELPPQVPLFYSLPESENQIAPMFYLLLIPIVECLLVLTNVGVRSMWFKDSPMMSEFITRTNYVIIGSMTYAFVKIIFLIT